MMVDQLLQTIAQTGGRVTVDGANLVLKAPRPLTEDLLAEVKRHKADLLAALADFYDDPVLARYDAAWKRRAAAEPGFEPTAEARYCCECSNLAPDKRCTAWQRLGAPKGWQPSDKAPRKCRGFAPAKEYKSERLAALTQPANFETLLTEACARVPTDHCLMQRRTHGWPYGLGCDRGSRPGLHQCHTVGVGCGHPAGCGRVLP